MARAPVPTPVFNPSPTQQFPQMVQPSPLRALSAQMARQPAVPAYDAFGAIASFGQPIVAAMLQRRGQEDERRQRREAMDELARGLREVADAGGGQMAALNVAQRMEDPFAQQMLLQQAMAPRKPQETFSTLTPQEVAAAGYAPGTVVQVSDLTGQQKVAQAPAKVAAPFSPEGKLAADLESGAITPTAYEAGLKRLRKPLVEMGEQQSAEDKEFGKSLVKGYEAVRDRAIAAQDQLALLETARNIDVETGAFAPLQASIAAYAEGIGGPEFVENLGLERATNAQAFRGIMNNLVLTKMQAQKGPQTENDARRIEQTLANLTNTAEANDFLFRSAIAIENRRAEQLDFYDSYRENQGTLEGARGAWERYKKQTPMIKSNPKTGLPVFYNEFRKGVLERNPEMDEDLILKVWREKYV